MEVIGPQKDWSERRYIELLMVMGLSPKTNHDFAMEKLRHLVNNQQHPHHESYRRVMGGQNESKN